MTVQELYDKILELYPDKKDRVDNDVTVYNVHGGDTGSAVDCEKLIGGGLDINFE